MRYVLLGGGILGSGYRASFAHRGVDVVSLAPEWLRPRSPAVLLTHALAAPGPATVVWAAGVGHIGADEEAMRTETATVASICDVLRGRPGETTFVFASSAGAIFAGHGSGEIAEDAEPWPITPYGREKLRQEKLLDELADEASTRVVVCRYTNLFGLARGQLTARGLVSTAVRATRLRQPMVVYVSPDTRRDLVYNVDAAAESLRIAASASHGVTTALVAAGETRTVSEILALIGRVSGRRVPATYAERAETRVQPRVLRFRTAARRSSARMPMEAALHLMLRAPMV
jgi:UDP-glucose 4-epimerase